MILAFRLSAALQKIKHYWSFQDIPHLEKNFRISALGKITHERKKNTST